jgi:hypothetical protein
MSSLSLRDAKDIADSIRPADNSFPIVAIVKALREAYSSGYCDAKRETLANGGAEKVIEGLQAALSDAEVRINELRAVIRMIVKE